MREAFRWSAWLLLGMLTFTGATLSAADEGGSAALLTRLSEFHQHQQALSSLAEQQTDAEEIRELAEEIAVDHQILDEWLQEAGHAAQQRDDGSAGGSVDQDAASEAYEALQSQEGVEFDRQFLDYQATIHRQALNYLQENRPESIEASERTNHLKITHETLRKHLGLIQHHRPKGGEPPINQ